MENVKNVDASQGIENRLKAIFKASVIMIIVNISIGIFKAIVGLISHSIAITMDALNNFTDAGSSFITILSSYFASKDPDKKHPFGYGRTEYLGTLLIAIIILYAGVTSFVESVKSIFNPGVAEYSAVTIIIIVVAIIAKAVLSLYISKVGSKVKSDSLMAAAKESIGDIAISVSTIVAALIYIFAGISVEAWLGVIIAILIVKTGIEILKETIDKILGTGGDAALVRNIKSAICENDEVIGAYDLVLHNYGPEAYLASVHLEVKDTLAISEFDELSRQVQYDIQNRFGVFLTSIGVYSSNTRDPKITEIRDDVKTIALSSEHIKQMHGFYIDEDNKNMRFDLVVSFEAKDRRKAHSDAIEKIKSKYPEYNIEAGMDVDYNEV